MKRKATDEENYSFVGKYHISYMRTLTANDYVREHVICMNENSRVLLCDCVSMSSVRLNNQIHKLSCLPCSLRLQL